MHRKSSQRPHTLWAAFSGEGVGLGNGRWLLGGERDVSGMFTFYSLNLGGFEFLSVGVHSCICN